MSITNASGPFEPGGWIVSRSARATDVARKPRSRNPVRSSRSSEPTTVTAIGTIGYLTNAMLTTNAVARRTAGAAPGARARIGHEVPDHVVALHAVDEEPEDLGDGDVVRPLACPALISVGIEDGNGDQPRADRASAAPACSRPRCRRRRRHRDSGSSWRPDPGRSGRPCPGSSARSCCRAPPSSPCRDQSPWDCTSQCCRGSCCHLPAPGVTTTG